MCYPHLYKEITVLKPGSDADLVRLTSTEVKVREIHYYKSGARKLFDGAGQKVLRVEKGSRVERM